MILADKIITLRKSRGWSQEELAQRLNVTRQSVSKWESAQSVPDLERIVQMSRLFGVSTDYLLIEDAEKPEIIPAAAESSQLPEKAPESAAEPLVSPEEAGKYLAVRRRCAPRIALGVLMCIFAPIPLLFLGAMTETHPHLVSENFAGGAGVIVLLCIAAAAVAVFLRTDAMARPYRGIPDGTLSRDAAGEIRAQQQSFAGHRDRIHSAAAALCILSPISLLAAAFLTENVFVLMLALAGTMLIAGCGAALFILVGVPWEAMQRLLREGDYAPEKNTPTARLLASFHVAYWLLAVSVYLFWSFCGDAWGRSWLLWPVAGVLYGAVCTILRVFTRNP